MIASAGVRPNIEFLQAAGRVGLGVQVDGAMRTSVPEGSTPRVTSPRRPSFHTGKPDVNAIQPDAVEQARVGRARHGWRPRSRAPAASRFNVLDTLGLVSTSFGQWGVSPAGRASRRSTKHVSLPVACSSRTTSWSAPPHRLTDHVGALRGLIQGRIRLGEWKDRLLRTPGQFVEAYVARSQPTSVVR